jgi:hypothetical protein
MAAVARNGKSEALPCNHPQKLPKTAGVRMTAKELRRRVVELEDRVCELER